MFRPFYFDVYYLYLIIPAMLIAAFAQMKVSSTFSKYSKVMSKKGRTACEIARNILNENGLSHIRVERIAGKLTDHFDPTSNTIRLSDSVYNSSSVASIGVAAHECGHAIQHETGYFPIKIRTAVIPITNIGSKLSIPLILLGVILGFTPLITVGILAFSLITVFQLVTLPVEFNASSRALKTLGEHHMLDEQELSGSKKVLSAAAMTYVAALIMSVAQLLRLIMLYGGRRRD